MEYDNKYEHNYASRGQVNLNTVLGSLGTAGALGLLDKFLGNENGNGKCSEDHYINRYEAALSARINELETEVKLRDANIYTDSKLNDFRNYVDSKFDGVNAAICQQNVYNASNTNMLNCISGQVAQLMALTKVAIPIDSICPEPMRRFNSWTAPTTTTTTGA